MAFWIIAKPETLLFCKQDLETYLLSKDFQVNNVRNINDWDHLSIDIYSKSDKVSLEQLHLQNIGRNQILGHAGTHAELWELIPQKSISIEDGYKKLNILKYDFRKIKWHNGLNIFFSIDEYCALYHYSYFHVPEPDLNIIEKEISIIRKYLI